MRAVPADQAGAALVILEGDEVLAEKLHRLNGPVAGKLIDQRRRLPIAPQSLPATVPGLARVMRSFCSALSIGEGLATINARVPGAAQHAVVRCRPGISTDAELTVPDQRCTASRCTASGKRSS